MATLLEEVRAFHATLVTLVEHPGHPNQKVHGRRGLNLEHTFSQLPKRTMSQGELGSAVTNISKVHASELDKLMKSFPNKRGMQSLFESDHHSVWLLEWSGKDRTEFHDHGGSAVGIRVLRGAVTEMYIAPGSKSPGFRTFKAGSTVSVPNKWTHDMYATGTKKGSSYSLHIYSPPLKSMTYFADDGKTAKSMWNRTKNLIKEALQGRSDELCCRFEPEKHGGIAEAFRAGMHAAIAILQEHPGHPNQKVHGRRKGTGYHSPDPSKDHNGDGVAEFSRVGVHGSEVPDKIPRLPGLTKSERRAETVFAEMYEKDPDGMARKYLGLVKSGKLGDGPGAFATDDAKMLSPHYNPKQAFGGDPRAAQSEAVKAARGKYNTATFQTANAITKRAFVMHLDELNALPKGHPRRTVLITSGGTAAGKGFLAAAMGGKVGGVWDSAGELNGVENPWVAGHLKRRGMKGIFGFVDAHPETIWTHPKRGIVSRAQNIGRMIDARLFADSYTHGPKNFAAFAKKHAPDPDFTMQYFRVAKDIQPGQLPDRIRGIPRETLSRRSDDLHKFAVQDIHSRRASLPKRIVDPALAGNRIWGAPKLTEAVRLLGHPSKAVRT